MTDMAFQWWASSDAVSFVLSVLPFVLLLYFIGLLVWRYRSRANSLQPCILRRKPRKRHKKRKPLPVVLSSTRLSTDAVGEQVPVTCPKDLRSVNSPVTSHSHLPTDHNLCKSCELVAAKTGCRYECCRPCCEAQPMSVCAPHNTGARVADMLLDEALKYPPANLDFSYQHLRRCSPRIGEIGLTLTSLNLSNNRLRSIPEEVCLLTNVEELFLQYNLLETLPDSICCLTALAELDVKNNLLTCLPEDIGLLSELIILNLTNNSLRTLPDSICDLERLEELCVHANRLVKLPSNFCQLSRLESLYLGSNRLSALPESFGNISRLTEADFSNNEIALLPESFVNCQRLERLWLAKNRLKRLPTRMGWLSHLTELHVQNNQLRYLPLSLHRLHLYALTTTNNPFLSYLNKAALSKLEIPAATPFPPLQELAARAAAQRPTLPTTSELPSHLVSLLRSRRWCTNCGGPFFIYGSQKIVYCTVAVYYRLPLLEEICSPHGTEHCKQFTPPD